jgi:nucleotide-binding universal stress UspA family protein
MKKFEIKKILFPTDFSETANIALRQAIFMARLAKAELKLLYVIEPEMNFSATLLMPQTESYYERLKKNLLNKLKNIASEIHKETSIDVTYETRFDGVYKQICNVAQEEDFDLIIMGTHGNSGISELFAGSNAGKVVTHCECPVITLQKKLSNKGFRNIILPIRAEANSRQKVDYVVELAKLYSASIHITGYAKESNKKDQGIVKQYVKQVEKYLKGLDISCNTTLIIGDNFIKEILLHAKKNKADLIAVMNETDFNLDQLIKGPYAKQFVNHSTIPILSVPVSSDPDLITYSPYLSGALPG